MAHSDNASDLALVQAVHDAYSARARSGTSEPYAKTIAQAFGYTPDQLQAASLEANMGLGCGNPVAAASIKEGERILDLGCGGGFDILLAASKVGPTGQAIGLDMSLDMINRARRNAARQQLRPPQAAFIPASLSEPLPIASASIDCVLSNCVINLLPLSGKARLFKEVARVLKPGGRVVLDDIVAKQELPDNIRNDLAAHVGCIAGAIEVEVYKRLLTDAGLAEIVFVKTFGDINVYFQTDDAPAKCCPTEPGVQRAESTSCSRVATIPQSPSPGFDANNWVASYQIYALKPWSSEEEGKIAPEPLLRWWDAYPAVNSLPGTVPIDEVACLIKDKTSDNKDYVVIDVRRNDYAGGHIRGSIQFPAQTFYDDLPEFFKKFGNVSRVIFYCGSSSGRAPRCAGWYQDYLDEKGSVSSKGYVLEGGINAWLNKYGDDMELVDRD